MKQYIPTEDQEQTALFQWCEMQKYCMPELALLFHVPNGGSRNKIEAAKLRRMGVKPGVPDLFLPVARGGYHGLFIELKRTDGGRVRKIQAAWLKELRKQGYRAEVSRGWIKASEIITDYLKGER